MSTIHWLALHSLSGIGGVTARSLLERFGHVEAVFAAPDEALLAVPRFTPAMLQRLRAVSLEATAAELRALAAEGLQVLTWDDAAYPANLRTVRDAPPLLFVRGELLPRDAHAVAVIGSRRSTEEKAALAEALARELAARGLTVVSGLALGIDSAAHRGALAAEGGRTLAVPGSGLCNIHPRSNRGLAEAVARRGALLSELQPGAPPTGPNLMARDRIQSGLSRAVIVVEAAEKSGTSDTARRAQRQGRLVLAVPGSPGADALIAAGAERLDPAAADLDALAARLRAEAPAAPGAQLSLWNWG